MLKITIPGNPIAKKRPRFARRGKFVTIYSDQETEEGKAFLQIKEQVNGHKPFEGAVSVRSVFYMPRPKNHFGTGRNDGKLKPSAPKYHTKKPDIDNLIKFYYDIMNVLVWEDDAQVVSESSEKKYCRPGEQPGIEIDVIECED